MRDIIITKCPPCKFDGKIYLAKVAVATGYDRDRNIIMPMFAYRYFRRKLPAIAWALRKRRSRDQLIPECHECGFRHLPADDCPDAWDAMWWIW